MFLIDKGIDWLCSAIDTTVDFFIPDRPSPYPAHFASEKKSLFRHQSGFCLTGRRNLTAQDSFRNTLVVGGSGSGKSSVVILPSLLTMQGSFVVHDPSGELYANSAGYLYRRGYDIRVLNFAQSEHSDGYNPLARASQDSEIHKVAHLLVATTLQQEDPFWSLQATNLLSMLIQVVKGGPYENLRNVRDLLTLMQIDQKKLAGMVEQVSPRVYQEYQAFCTLEDKVKSGVMATALAALQLFTDTKVSQVTAHDTIDFELIRRRPTVLYLQSPVAEASYYQSLMSVFLEQLLRRVLLTLPGTKELNLFFLIDEAASFHLPTLSTAIANVRKYRVGMLLAVQDFQQLIHRYGEAEARTIKSNCLSELYLGSQPLATGQELSQLLGLTRMKTEDEQVLRPLLTPDELRTLPASKGLLVSGNHQPMLVKLTPYYRNRKLAPYTRFPTPARIITHPKLQTIL